MFTNIATPSIFIQVLQFPQASWMLSAAPRCRSFGPAGGAEEIWALQGAREGLAGMKVGPAPREIGILAATHGDFMEIGT